MKSDLQIFTALLLTFKYHFDALQVTFSVIQKICYAIYDFLFTYLRSGYRKKFMFRKVVKIDFLS